MKLKKVVFFLFILSTTLFSQNIEEEAEKIHFAIIEKAPIYPGCRSENNTKLKKCMSENISIHVSKIFNKKNINKKLKPGLYKINVQFIIDKKGKVKNIQARADYPELEAEAIRVVESLPRMEPGKQKGKNVGVIYSLPISFRY